MSPVDVCANSGMRLSSFDGFTNQAPFACGLMAAYVRLWSMTKALLWLMFLCIALPAQDWKQSLTFLASFDRGLDADFALGDKRIYTASDYKAQMEAKPDRKSTRLNSS